jgi:hypothetical protein
MVISTSVWTTSLTSMIAPSLVSGCSKAAWMVVKSQPLAHTLSVAGPAVGVGGRGVDVGGKTVGVGDGVLLGGSSVFVGDSVFVGTTRVSVGTGVDSNHIVGDTLGFGLCLHPNKITMRITKKILGNVFFIPGFLKVSIQPEKFLKR